MKSFTSFYLTYFCYVKSYCPEDWPIILVGVFVNLWRQMSLSHTIDDTKGNLYFVDREEELNNTGARTKNVNYTLSLMSVFSLLHVRFLRWELSLKVNWVNNLYFINSILHSDNSLSMKPSIRKFVQLSFFFQINQTKTN